MDERWQLLLQRLTIDANSDILQGIIKNTKFFKDKNELYIEIEYDDPLSYENVEFLLENLQKSPISIKLKIINKSTITNQKLYEYFVNYYKKNGLEQISSLIKLDNFNYDGEKIQVLASTKQICTIINSSYEKLKNWLHVFGIDILGINCELDQVENHLNKNIKNQEVELIKKDLKEKIKNTVLDPYIKLNQISENPTKIADFESPGKITIIGKIFKKEIKHLKKSDKHLGVFSITDYTSSTTVKLWCEKEGSKNRFGNSVNIVLSYLESFNEGDWIKVSGLLSTEIGYNEGEFSVNAYKILKIDSPIPERIDDAEEKRVEFQLHTKMTAMDGVTSIDKYIEQAKKWNMDAIAITDRYSAQAFPQAQRSAGKDIKVIYGVEFDMIEDEYPAVFNVQDRNLKDDEYVIFDLETTGLSAKTEEIIEFGGIKVKNGNIISSKQLFIKPSKPIPFYITQITNITNELVENAPSISDCIEEIKEFIGDATLVAHNAQFDLSFMDMAWKNNGYGAFKNPVIDTLQISRSIHSDTRRHRLVNLAKRYKIKYDESIAHRADYDAEVLHQVFSILISELQEKYNITNQNEINASVQTRSSKEKAFGKDIIVYAKNQLGLKNLFKLISISHTEEFFGSPKLLRSTLNKFRSNLLVTNGAYYGEIFETALSASQEDLEKQMEFYDFITVQPLMGFSHMWQTGNAQKSIVEKTLKCIITTCFDNNKICVATSNAYYLSKTDKILRDIYIVNKGIGGKTNRIFDYKNRVKENPDAHLRTTNELIKEFAFVSPEIAKKICIDNSRLISSMIEPVKPIKENLYTPTIEGVNEKLSDMCYKNARKMYGEKLPVIVEKRLKKELASIIGNGFSVVYWISSKLVEKSLHDGYLVGSRGSVGSSFVATVANISEVNPLKPHYLCLNCQHSEFNDNNGNPLSEIAECGFDLPFKKCPKCDANMMGEGHYIPFETFLGFKGDKVPDIDLNFSGDYQSRAHSYTKEMFGEEKVLRAGTISTVAEKTAFGYVKNYEELKGLKLPIAEIERLAKGCEGVKRTTGQHPGGIIVIPEEYEAEDFTPRNFPADDNQSSWKTTHFAFEAIHDNLLKLDILGHVDPTAIRMLQDLTGVDPKDIPFQDKQVLSLFNSFKAMNIDTDNLNGELTGAIGLPEFGTKFVREMLRDTNPQSFADLVRISGLSHGTDVWLGNAKDLIKKENWKLKNVIGCRDDIMVFLIKKGLDPAIAFKIMEDVRKGAGITPEYEKIMQKNNVDQLYIESCRKIKYMFPKAHATAYVMMAWRVSWFKLYYPMHYYATYFSLRCDSFDLGVILGGSEAIKEKIFELKAIEKKLLTIKEKGLLHTLEAAYEMSMRGIKIQNLSLEYSEPLRWSIKEGKLYPPFSALDGLGEAVANSVIKARKVNPFQTIQDLADRTQLTKTHIEILKQIGVTAHLSERNQLSLFEML